jgi:hypothetical protein
VAYNELQDKALAKYKELEEKAKQELDEERSAYSELQDKALAKYKELEAKAQQELEEERLAYSQLQDMALAKYKDLEDKAQQQLDVEHSAHVERQNKAMAEYKALEEKARKDLEDLQKFSADIVDAERLSHREQMESLQRDHEQEKVNLRNEAEEKMDKIVRKGKTMLKEAREKAAAKISTLEEALRDVTATLEQVQKEREEIEERYRAKVVSFKQKLKMVAGQASDYNQKWEDAQETITMIDREKAKLEEENEQYRKQLGGRYGEGGMTQNQMDKLQREFSALMEENRELKKKLKAQSSALPSITESSTEYDSSSVCTSYSRMGGSEQTLSQFRQEYEEMIEALNTEKRELVMKQSAAMADARKAERYAWERNEEVKRLKAENTSLQLALQRKEMGRESQDSFQEEDEKQNPDENLLPDESFAVEKIDPRRSRSRASPPGRVIRAGGSNLTNPTPRAALAPTLRYHNQAPAATKHGHNIESEGNVEASREPKGDQSKRPTLIDYTNAAPVDGQPECRQS